MSSGPNINMEPHRKGDLTESIVISEMMRRGIPVSRPFSDNERYDILVEDEEERLYKVQIKTGWIDSGAVTLRGSSQHTNSQGNTYKPYAGDVDFFFVYCHELESLYLLEESELESRIRLRVEEPKQVHRNMHWAEDYEFDRRWPPEHDGSCRLSNVGEPMISKAIGAFESVGALVFLPHDDDEKSLIAVNSEGGSYTISPQRGHLSDGRIHFDAEEKAIVDAYLVHVEELDQLYAIDADGFDSTITLRLDPPKRHQPGIKYAEDFEFDRNWPPTRLADPLAGSGEQTRATVNALEECGTDFRIEKTDGVIPTVIALVEERTHRIRPERGWRVDGCLRFDPTEGTFDWYSIYDPADLGLYLYDAEEAGTSVELRLTDPQKPDRTINFADQHRFIDNWPPEGTE